MLLKYYFVNFTSKYNIKQQKMVVKKTKYFSILLLTLILLGSCSGDDEVSNNPNYLYHISGKINGQPFVYGQLENATDLDYSQAGFGNSITTNCAYFPDTGGLNYAMGVYPNLNNESRPNMSFNFIRFYLCGGDGASATFNDSFPVGDYATAVSESIVSGTTGAVSLHYQPDSTESMVLYSSINDNQDGNYFKISSSTNTNQYLGSVIVSRNQLLEGTFNFTLYNTNNALETLEITEGHFKLYMTFD